MFYLEAQNIVKKYGDHTALSGVSIGVPQGCIYGLLGPNGAGKSSLIRIINRITAPDEGQVLLNGRPSEPQDIFNIGYMPEERGLYKKMTVGEHIMFLARLRGLSKAEARKRMDYWLNKFAITTWENKRVQELSKGMQQKIQFIVTVIHSPELLILDEPFSGLDPVNAELLKNEILELKAQGKTVILSTHNMGSVEELCDRITLINKSKVMIQGDVKEVRAQYREYIFTLEIAGLNGFNVVSLLFETLIIEPQKQTTVVKIKKLNPETPNSEIIKTIIEKYEILSFEEELPTMNDIFIQIVSQSNK